MAENNFGRGPAGVKKFKIPKNGLSADFNCGIVVANILVFICTQFRFTHDLNNNLKIYIYGLSLLAWLNKTYYNYLLVLTDSF